ncbi:MAG TPA: hypothetical protein VFE98_06200 [Candidatus Bathyarchaeia archaeon]|nr:hypothetical protein [Candidatus Bathyarchaeia archaeon]
MRPRVSKKIAQNHQPGRNTSVTHRKNTLGETYVFECTRPGCGYRIWHDEKHEPGQVRFDMKCPKCHNHQFKCLGKGEIPGTFELPVPMEVLDLNNISPTELGSRGS